MGEAREYYATFRKNGERIPSSMTFRADNPTEAISTMCTNLGVMGTMSLEEFEILEVLGNNKYASAAIKVAKSATTKERLEKLSRKDNVLPAVTPPAAPPSVPPSSPPVADAIGGREEKSYNTYQREAA